MAEEAGEEGRGAAQGSDGAAVNFTEEFATDWKPFFAWRPVNVGGRYAWWRWVECRIVPHIGNYGIMPMNEYREIR